MTHMPSSIALHLGAHKTASSHLQRSLAGAELSGVTFVGPAKLRGRGQTLPERFGFPLDEKRADNEPVVVSNVLCSLSSGADRLVLSDENFAGKLQTGWGRVPLPIYPTAAKRLALLVEAIRAANGPQPDLFLCIRNPAGFLTSTYSQVLHGGRRVRPTAFVAKNDPGKVDWVDYVARLRSVAGIGSLTVWRYEDYTQMFGEITRLLTGQSGIVAHECQVQKRLSQAALDVLMRAKEGGMPLTASEAAKAYPRADGEAGFAIYDSAVQATSARAYADQWLSICRLSGVTALQPQ